LSKVDLHIHSTASDGRLSPEDVVHKAARLGLAVIAIADHDTIDGVAPAQDAARDFPGLTVVSGVEINTDVPTGEAHVLGYFLDYRNAELQTILAQLRNSRQERAQQMIAKLANLGVHIDWQTVLKLAGSGSVGRPHLARAMLENGHVTSLKEAFVRYIGRGCPAYVERAKITPAEAVALVLKAEGLPVLAHPFTLDDPEAMVIKMKAAGLAGIEAYYNNYTANQTGKLAHLARRHNLITTVGSDYHGLDETAETMIGGVEAPVETVERLVALVERQNTAL
jgi:predicted metal-dependent phosphoesterase TrpH